MQYTAPRRLAVLVLHRDPLLRAGLATALRQHPAFETLVDGVDGATCRQPGMDVLVADYENAMLLAQRAEDRHGASTAARTLVVTSNDREADIRRAIEAGIHGYVLMSGPLAEVIDGVKAVSGGLRYLSRTVAQRLADSLTHAPLTSREAEVLSLVAAGESNKAIARELQIEIRTVKSHMTSIMGKLGVTSRTQAAGIAVARGLVEPSAALRCEHALRRTGTNEERARR